jgi:hypothetical protein
MKREGGVRQIHDTEGIIYQKVTDMPLQNSCHQTNKLRHLLTIPHV